MRLLDGSGLSVGAGLRLAQTGAATLGLSSEATAILNALKDPAKACFNPTIMLNGGTMWLSSDAGAQTRTVTLKRGLNLSETRISGPVIS